MSTSEGPLAVGGGAYNAAGWRGIVPETWNSSATCLIQILRAAKEVRLSVAPKYRH